MFPVLKERRVAYWRVVLSFFYLAIWQVYWSHLLHPALSLLFPWFLPFGMIPPSRHQGQNTKSYSLFLPCLPCTTFKLVYCGASVSYVSGVTLIQVLIIVIWTMIVTYMVFLFLVFNSSQLTTPLLLENLPEL